MTSEEGFGQAASRLDGLLAKASAGELVAGAERYGPPQGDPSLVPLVSGGETVGYASLTSAFVNPSAYAGTPHAVIPALDAACNIPVPTPVQSGRAQRSER